MTRRHPSREPSQRQRRVNELLRHALAEILTRGDISDQELAGEIVTVTEVEASADLRNARVYVIPLGGEKQEQVVAALRRHTRFLRGELARKVTLKYMPALSFELDKRFDSSTRIEALLRSGTVARDLAGGSKE
ncbi:MAG: 30S ribosome-binding factor RbfA [Alphaproteobacteria bacterium]|nr:MAG: 30S ribosome-binding factor RbfA [Alphaproteobacteria bacterium]